MGGIASIPQTSAQGPESRGQVQEQVRAEEKLRARARLASSGASAVEPPGHDELRGGVYSTSM